MPMRRSLKAAGIILVIAAAAISYYVYTTPCCRPLVIFPPR